MDNNPAKGIDTASEHQKQGCLYEETWRFISAGILVQFLKIPSSLDEITY